MGGYGRVAGSGYKTVGQRSQDFGTSTFWSHMYWTRVWNFWLFCYITFTGSSWVFATQERKKEPMNHGSVSAGEWRSLCRTYHLFDLETLYGKHSQVPRIERISPSTFSAFVHRNLSQSTALLWSLFVTTAYPTCSDISKSPKQSQSS